MIVMFVLLMLFLFKYIDDLIGKGFEWYIIMELMLYASATNVAMALPLSVLLSSIMTYGSLGENYELVAIKSAGISLRRALYPMLLVVAIISIAAFFFSDYMLPKANLKYFSLLYDARQQKSANFLPEGIFSSSFPGFSIRVEHKDEDGQTLHGVMIYSKDESNNTAVLLAKEGKMYRTPSGNFLVLVLKDGVRYSEQPGASNFNNRERLVRYRFKQTEQKFDISGFNGLHRTNESEFKSAYQMMDLKLLRENEKSNRHLLDSNLNLNYKLITAYIKYFSIPKKSAAVKKFGINNADTVKTNKLSRELSALTDATSEARSIQDFIKNRADNNKETLLNIHKAVAEYHAKFTLPAACLALFLIGAPLGAIIRKGGLGLPVVVSVVLFLLFYIVKTIGEKAAKEGNLSPIIGSWIAIIIITPIGLFLSYKASTDSALFDMDVYKRFFNKLAKYKPLIKKPLQINLNYFGSRQRK